MRLSENAHLPFDRPFDRLTVLRNVEGLTALSKVEGLRYPHPPPCYILAKRDGGADLTGQVTAVCFNVRLIPRDFAKLNLQLVFR